MSAYYQAGNYIEFFDDMYDECGNAIDLSTATDVEIRVSLEDVYLVTETGAVDPELVNRVSATVTTMPDADDAEGTWSWQFFVTLSGGEIVRGNIHKIVIKANLPATL